MKAITVFTPTYNRAYTLPQLYDSLVRQTDKNFKWLIIDDGSVDNTEEIVKGWINEGKVEIQYIYQENKGMLYAHNTAHSLLSTELAVCIDSDDFMTDDAIERILGHWPNYVGKANIAGMVGLDCYKDGKIIGNSFEEEFAEIKYKDVKKLKGDKKYIYRSEIFREFGPYPHFEGEKFPADVYLYSLIDSKYDIVAINDVLCVVEYLPDGNSFNKMGSYLKNPKSFAVYRLHLIEVSDRFNDKFRNAVHYVSSCIISKEYIKIFANKFFYLTIPALPLGIALFFYLKYKRGGAVNKRLNK